MPSEGPRVAFPPPQALRAEPALVTPRIVANGRRTCALSATGAVACWGEQLSDWSVGATTVSGLEATDIAFHGATLVVRERRGRILSLAGDVVPASVAAFAPRPDLTSTRGSCDNGTCCFVVEGRVLCRGSNSWDRLGAGGEAREELAPVPGVSDAVTVSVGASNACALTASAEIICWGSNQSGQVGADSSGRDRSGAVKVTGLEGVVEVEVGYDATCARNAQGEVFCWGSNLFGALGTEYPGESARPLRVPGIPKATALSFTSMHVCAVVEGGAVYCWGHGDDGELGNAVAHKGQPAKVYGLDDAVAVAAGMDHTCALRRDESVKCWGARDRGAFGDGQASEEHAPVAVEGVSGAMGLCVQSEVYPARTCALGPDHALVCWGDAGTRKIRSDVVACDAKCLVLTGGNVECEGHPAHGMTHAAAVSTWFQGGCTLGPDGAVTCRGFGAGAGAAGPLLRDARAVATGQGVGCALERGRTLACWGDVSRSGSSPEPLRVRGIDDAVELSLDTSIQLGSGLVRHAGGGVDFWYWAMAHLEGKTLDLQAKPLAGLRDAVALGGAAEDGCAVTRDGHVWCWGHNGAGELGNGSTSARVVRTPVEVRGLNDAVAVGVGGDFRCALRRDGGVACWGRNDMGQLGKPFVKVETLPVKVRRTK